MSAKHLLEDTLAQLLTEAEHQTTNVFPTGLDLGVGVFPGRTNQDWPPQYVAINGDHEEARSQSGVWLVHASIWVVTDSDSTAAVEASKRRITRINKWFGPRCPARRYRNSQVIIHGISISEGDPVNGDHSFADILALRCGVQVR